MRVSRRLRGAVALAFWAGWAVVTSPVANAAPFAMNDLYYASNTNGSIYNISGGGDLSGRTAFTTGAGASLGQLAWSSDLSTMYSTNFSNNRVWSVSSTGAAAVLANIANPTGLIRTRDNRLLVASFLNDAVYDITNPASITTFATGVANARNMAQLPNGKILVVGWSDSNSAPVVYDVTSGGTASVWATLPGNGVNAGDIDYTSTGRVFVSTGSGGRTVYELTATGSLASATPFATFGGNLTAFALAIDRRTDQILAASLSTNYVLDITSGGTFTESSPKWAFNVPATNDMAIDFVPEPGHLGLLSLALPLACARRRTRLW